MAAAREGWDFSCPDWKERLKAGTSLVPTLPIDAKEAARAVAIFNRLRLPDVAGSPSLGEAAGDWIRELVAALFGSIDADGVRHVGEFLELVPKKNTKTTSGAALMLTALLMEDPATSRNQQFHLYGPTQPIAELAFYQAVGMIRADPDGYLQKRFHVRDHLKTIKDEATGNELRVKTFDMKVSTGTIPKAVLVDELHILGSMHYAQRVIGQIRGGLMTRRDSFLGFITTQSDEPPTGAFRAELMVARGIRDGRITGKAARMLPVLYEFPEEVQTSDEWRDPAIWGQVNPNLGRSVTLDRLEADWAQAQEKDEAEIRRWASQHLNVEVGLALHSDRWSGADLWQQAEEPDLTLESLLERCEVVVVGLDGGGRDDLFGLAVAGREKGTGLWLTICHAWVIDVALERRKEIAPRLRGFEADGDLTLVSTGQDLVDQVAAKVAAVRDSGKMPAVGGIGVDAWGMGPLVDALVAAGFDPGDAVAKRTGQIVPVRQGVGLTGTIKTVEFKLGDRQLRHDGSELMAWCVSNARAELKGSNLYISKERAGASKIDPLIAMLNAVQLLEAGPVAETNNGGISSWLDSMRQDKAA